MAVMTFMYMIAGYCGYTYADDNGMPDDVMNAHALLGTSSLFILVTVLVELALGFVAMDHHQLWNFGFMFLCFCASIFQLASASLLASGYGDSASGSKGVDNFKAHGFFLYAAPMTIYILLGLLKFLDFRAAGNGELNESA